MKRCRSPNLQSISTRANPFEFGDARQLNHGVGSLDAILKPVNAIEAAREDPRVVAAVAPTQTCVISRSFSFDSYFLITKIKK